MDKTGRVNSMSLSNEEIVQILYDNPLEGLDYQDGLNRFGGQASIYLRIVNTFIESTPALLAELTKVTPETMAEYTVRIHGLKGSCYGISATVLGDEAKALELASKIFDWDTIQRDNPLVIEHAQTLINQLQSVMDKVEELAGQPAVS